LVTYEQHKNFGYNCYLYGSNISSRNICSNINTLKAAKQFITTVNNSLQNLGNPSSDFNYGAWGSYVAASPFTGYKGSFYEGGVRGPVVIKEPKSMSSSSSSSSSAPTSNNIVKSLALVTDITPTILQMANVSHPSTYKGHAVHPLMGKSIKPLLDGTADKVYADDEPISAEVFNFTSVRMGDWQAIHDAQDANGVWKLFNLANDFGENNNVADQHPDIVQKMKAAW
jgi:arylsulfatase A-like enzyme